MRHFAGFIFVLCGMSTIAAAEPPAGKHYAVLVGVNKYEHTKLPELKYAVNDASELSEVLKGQGYVISLLTDDAGAKDKTAKPTKGNIEKRLKKVLDGCKKDDTVLIALAGHGLQFDGVKDAFFCPSDARPAADRTDTLISLDKLYHDLDSSFAGVKVLLVDACRDDPNAARGGTRGVDADTAPRPPRGVAALFSCSAGERAFEHESVKHGLFFHFVLQGLRGEAKDSDDDISFDGLSAYVRKQVSRQVSVIVGDGARQSPNLKADLSGESPVLLRVNNLGLIYEEGLKYYEGNTVEKNLSKAIEKFRAAAKGGNTDAMFYLGYMLENGLAGPKDMKEAAQWYKKSADAGNTSATLNLGVFYENGTGVLPNIDEAIRLYRKAADGGEAIAMSNLGNLYEYGKGVAKDLDVALKWYRKSADAGCAKGMGALATMYESGTGVGKDLSEALKWYRKAAEGGDAGSMNSIGVLYEAGRGVKQDYVEALKWYRKAAEAGCDVSLGNIGLAYENGRGVPENAVEAAKWYYKGAEAGDTTAMCYLGNSYDNGRGVDEDTSEAVKWYRKAANAGDAEGMTSLGYMYANGRGVQKDYAQALRWYRKGVDGGNSRAMYNLGGMYESGWGVRPNLNEAVSWYRKAARAGYDDADQALQRLGAAR
ncbi:MAG: caspase family protein [Gemmataceae bacterium]